MCRKRSKPPRLLSKPSRSERDLELAREEALRPCPFLGFDRDQLGSYLVGRGALEIAESQFRRAMWLNPFEPSFGVHWALALLRLERRPEAHDILREVLARNPGHTEALELWHQNWPDERPAVSDRAAQAGAGGTSAEACP